MNLVGEAFSDLFLGNPFSTQIGALVEEATEDFVSAELWQLFSQVCDAVNRSQTGPKEAVRALRRRFINVVTSNETSAMHTLLLMETCMLNCGYRFRAAFATRECVRDIIRFASSEGERVPQRIKEKIVSLIQTWSLEYGRQVDFQEFKTAYGELKDKGIQFPEPTPATRTAAQTPSTQPASGHPTSVSMPNSGGQVSPPTITVPQPQSTQPAPLSGSNKLDGDLAQVRRNTCLLSDLVTENESPRVPDLETRQCMSIIAESLREMSVRLIQAISQWETFQTTLPNRGTSDSILMNMINVNDEVQTVLLRYSRAIRADENALTQADQTEFQDATQAIAQPTPKPGVNAPGFTNGTHGSEFDSFVGERVQQPSAATPQSPPTGPSEREAVALQAPGETATTDAPSGDTQLIDF